MSDQAKCEQCTCCSCKREQAVSDLRAQAYQERDRQRQAFQRAVEEFDQRHGGNGLNIGNNRLVFPDGAFRDGGPFGGAMKEHFDLDDPQQVGLLVTMKHEYQAARLRRAKQQFKELKRQLTTPQMAQRLTREHIAELRKLQQEVQAAENAVSAAYQEKDKVHRGLIEKPTKRKLAPAHAAALAQHERLQHELNLQINQIVADDGDDPSGSGWGTIVVAP